MHYLFQKATFLLTGTYLQAFDFSRNSAISSRLSLTLCIFIVFSFSQAWNKPFWDFAYHYKKDVNQNNIKK